ncbi:MAG: DNA replication/repair protein RecF [Clostridia bacterium]|nr:DNA replication/repair protein RecF [Clostridia bacterium]
MQITDIALRNFRNYAQAAFHPCAGVTALVGDNGQGKTALLEAVVLCCMGRSHRTPRDRELVRLGEETGRVTVTAQRRDGRHDVDMLLNRSARKTVKVNGNTLSRSGELMGHVSGVLFAPENLRLVKDGPEERRRFLDMAISQIRPSYYYALQRYTHALTQRNKLLRDIQDRAELLRTLDAWDEQLAQHGAIVMSARAQYIQKCAAIANEAHSDISGEKEKLDVRYEPSVRFGERPRPEELMSALQSMRENDLRRGTTLCGPHRDDIALLINGIDAWAYASQGQQRTVALALKLSELLIMKEELHEPPILMLDDVMSELDPQRRRRLLSHISGIQTIVTCTDMTDLSDAQIGSAWRVTNGELSLLSE